MCSLFFPPSPYSHLHTGKNQSRKSPVNKRQSIPNRRMGALCWNRTSYLAASFFVAFVAAVTEAAEPPTVTIPAGVVVGTTQKPFSEPNATKAANVYLGVPFASPPERFSPPQPLVPWTTPLLAQSPKPACIQQFGGSCRRLRGVKKSSNRQ